MMWAEFWIAFFLPILGVFCTVFGGLFLVRLALGAIEAWSRG